MELAPGCLHAKRRLTAAITGGLLFDAIWGGVSCVLAQGRKEEAGTVKRGAAEEVESIVLDAIAQTRPAPEQMHHDDLRFAEARRVTVIRDVAWLQEQHQWPALKGVVVVEAMREIGPKTERETCFYLTSSNLRADKLGAIVCDHCAIENSLHWVVDMLFRDDECRIRTENAPENVVTLKQMAINLARRKKGKKLRPPRPQNRRMGRRLSRQTHRSIISFTQFPCPCA